MDDQDGIVQQAKDAVTDPDHSLGEKAPGAPFAFVALSYLAILAAVSIVVAIVVWASSGGQ